MAPLLPEKCPLCIDGITTVRVVEAGKPDESFQFECYICHGTGKISREMKESIDYEKRCWCTCGHDNRPNGPIFVDNGPCHIVIPEVGPCKNTKHHYHCQRCWCVTQIG